MRKLLAAALCLVVFFSLVITGSISYATASWFPLGGRGNTQTLFNDETISGIALKHGKSSAQIILRWHLQSGNIAIPGSSNENHILENWQIFDFELSEEEMNAIAGLEQDIFFSESDLEMIRRYYN